jgi:hypothetical protein
MAGFVSMQHPQSIYYLTGMGGQLATGLGEELSPQGMPLHWRERVVDFDNSASKPRQHHYQ